VGRRRCLQLSIVNETTIKKGNLDDMYSLKYTCMKRVKRIVNFHMDCQILELKGACNKSFRKCVVGRSRFKAGFNVVGFYTLKFGGTCKKSFVGRHCWST